MRDSALPVVTVSLPTDSALARQLEAAHDYVKEESWVEATYLLQALLDTREDVLVSIRRGDADSKEGPRWTGARIEADRLLGNLPARGRELYETVRGPQARALLTEATQKGDLHLLAEVAERYFHTAAGADATRLLGVHHLDRGRFELASLCFGRLLDRVGADRLPPATLVASVLAFRLSGNEGRARQLWTHLGTRVPTGVRLDDRLVSLSELEKELTRFQASAAEASGRSEQGLGSAPLLEARWTQSTAHEADTRQWVQSAVQRTEDRSELVLPASVPVLAGDKVIYRSYRGIQAVDRQTGKRVWEAASDWSLDRMVGETRYRSYLTAWVSGYMANNSHLLFENSTLGTLSTDGSRVYAVEDLPIPPYPLSSASSGRRRGPVLEVTFGPDLTDPAHHSRLLALDTASGKLVWEIGGRGETAGSELNDSHFLGPPLPLDGRLFGVVEKNQELRLVCLDAAQGSLLWKQALVVPLNRLLGDVGRRVEALPPAYGQGILVCPTNAGVVLGVDLFQRSLAWAYVYREEGLPLDWEQLGWGRRGWYTPRELPRLREDWKAAVPMIHADKVLLTAPDTSAVHCLDLHSGTLLWKAHRMEDDLYVAGIFRGKVLIVGKQSCRALGLADGKALWTVETGLPSGQGVAAGSIYYLPLKSALPEKWVLPVFGASTVGLRGLPLGQGTFPTAVAVIAARAEKRPAVCALDLDRGAILERTPAPRGEVPGNLVLGTDTVFSQTALAVTAYPQQKNDKDKPTNSRKEFP
ncbi:MAG: PQQ-like beta-propeller repeat protein [Gemmataceae bacterium]|nr:PQQ-like beta-propeller repeat protein [Gemmataceae bacterium]